jgi:predicted enzyme related to lactoylglutathione lyase
MIGNISWFEVVGRDADALAAFYSGVLGWTLQVQPTPVGAYAFSKCEETGIAGGVGAAPQGNGWTTVYVEVDSLERAIEAATARGGSVLMPPTQLPNTRIAVIADPEGHPMGLSEPATA